MRMLRRAYDRDHRLDYVCLSWTGSGGLLVEHRVTGPRRPRPSLSPSALQLGCLRWPKDPHCRNRETGYSG